MMRHSVIFAAQTVEPDPAGAWVRHDEAAKLEAAVASKDREIAKLLRDQDAKTIRLDQDISEKDSVIRRQMKVIKAAKERLKTLGHSPNCASRYGKVGVDGHEINGACNCGLESWLSESGLG